MVSRTAQFTEIYEYHHRSVLAFCLRRTAEADAYDAASEVFSVAWRRLDDVPEGDRQLAWLYGVARKVLSRQWRGGRRFRRLVERMVSDSRAPDPDVELVVARRIEQTLVMDAASKLRESDQEILRLAAWEGLTHSEIADLLGISVPAVDQRFHRAKKRLADAYENANGAVGSLHANEGPS